MDFELSDEQLAVVDTVRRFVTNELYPHENEVERLGDVPPISSSRSGPRP
jgi:acyl-CoA dehydrogenase